MPPTSAHDVITAHYKAGLSSKGTDPDDSVRSWGKRISAIKKKRKLSDVLRRMPPVHARYAEVSKET